MMEISDHVELEALAVIINIWVKYWLSATTTAANSASFSISFIRNRARTFVKPMQFEWGEGDDVRWLKDFFTRFSDLKLKKKFWIF